MKKVQEVLGKLVVKAGRITAKSNLNVNSPWFYNQPIEPDSLREKRREREGKNHFGNDVHWGD